MSRFSGNGKLVNRVLTVIKTCFNEGNVNIFNDVAANAINVIYKVSFIILINKNKKENNLLIHIYFVVD